MIPSYSSIYNIGHRARVKDHKWTLEGEFLEHAEGRTPLFLGLFVAGVFILGVGVASTNPSSTATVLFYTIVSFIGMLWGISGSPASPSLAAGALGFFSITSLAASLEGGDSVLLDICTLASSAALITASTRIPLTVTLWLQRASPSGIRRSW